MESINDYISQVLRAVDTDDTEQLEKLKAQGNRLNTTYSEVAEVMLNFISTSNLQLDFIPNNTCLSDTQTSKSLQVQELS